MAETWARRIEASQRHPTLVLGGHIYTRHRVGEELDPPPDQRHCPSCFAAKGQFHCCGCDREVCPRCGSQLIGCNCSKGKQPSVDPVVTPTQIADIRGSIDVIDECIAQMLVSRRRLSQDIQTLKRSAELPTRDTTREVEIANQYEQRGAGLGAVSAAIVNWCCNEH